MRTSTPIGSSSADASVLTAFAAFPNLGKMAACGRSLNVQKLSAADFGCFTWIKSILTSIGKLLSHQYSDFRMFWRAFNSMGHGTTRQDIQNRIQALGRFRNRFMQHANNPAADRSGRNAVRAARDLQAFRDLGAPARSLLFRINLNFMLRYCREGDANRSYEMRSEIAREFKKAIDFQNALKSVNTFYNFFNGNRTHYIPPALPINDDESVPGSDSDPASESSSASSSASEADSDEESSVPANNPVSLPASAEEIPVPPPPPLFLPRGQTSQESFEEIINAIDRRRANRQRNRYAIASHTNLLQVPGTVPYTNGIPQEIRDKAYRIYLKTTPQFGGMDFTNLIPEPPGEFSDEILPGEIMLLPVFDSSHTRIQSALRVLAQPEGSVTPSERSTAENHLISDRHCFNLKQLEDWLSGHSNCPKCRENIDAIVFDTNLQDRILEFVERECETREREFFADGEAAPVPPTNNPPSDVTTNAASPDSAVAIAAAIPVPPPSDNPPTNALGG